MRRSNLVMGALLTAVMLPLAAIAATNSPPTIINSNQAGTEVYWTADRLAKAVPMPLPAVGYVPPGSELMSAPPEALISDSGAGPTLHIAPSNARLFTPVQRASGAGVGPEMYGSQTYRFTSSRLMTDAGATLGAERKYPYEIEGQLSFTIPAGTTQPAGNYVCSATVQRLGVITTAGHCVSDGSGHFYTNWVFVPATRSGSAPFGSWTWHQVTTTTTWFNGGGGVPNAQDVAVIVLNQNANKQYIGSLTGYAGFQIPDLYAGQHLTVLGYPCNLDNCAKDHRTDAQAVGGSNNTDIVGSDASGGASGGGWLVNFGEYATGQPVSGASDTIGNALVAATSYGPIASGVLYLGASILDTRYVQCTPLNTCNTKPTAILNSICVANPGAC